MIRNSFILLPGISYEKEKQIWSQNISSWNDFINARRVKGISWMRKPFYDRQLTKAKNNLNVLNSPYFDNVLPKSEHWRLYDYFKDDCVFLDIETTGLDKNYSDITVVGLFDGFKTKTMIKGINLDFIALKEELQKYKMIVTFNGSCFDVPFIEAKQHGLIPRIPHFDLRFGCAKLGLTGGLKNIEKQFNVQRRALVENMNGGDAVTLWRMYKATGDEHYLNLLVEYNEEDIINLKKIADFAYAELRTNTVSSITSNQTINNIGRACYKHQY